MSQAEPPNKRSLLEVVTTAALRLSLLAGAVLLFLWLQEDSERWNAAMLWLLAGLGVLAVWYGTPRVTNAVRCWRQERELLKCAAITGAVGGMFSGPFVVAYFLGVVSGALALIAVGVFWAGFFLFFAMMAGEDAC